MVKLAGEGAFERGEDYFERGAVGELQIKGNHISAEVEGSEYYQVKLTYTRKTLDGACDCPASDGIDFCKHCVATAMALRAQLKEPALEKSAKPVEIIATYLQRQSKDQLVTLLTEVINGDKELRQEWLIRAENALGTLDKKTIRKRITSAIPFNRNYYRYADVRRYFQQVEHTLEILEEPVRQLPPEEQLEILDYALERIVKAQDTVDDSGGFRYPSIGLIQTIYQSAFNAVDWNDDRKADYLIRLLVQDDYNLYGEIPVDYERVISPACMDLFYEKVQQRWDSLPRLNTDDWDTRREYSALLQILAWEPKQQNDYRALIALNQKVARKDYEYQNLAKLSLELKDYEQAQSFVDEAVKKGGQHGVSGLLDIQQTIWLNTDQQQKALDKQWEVFQERSHSEEYKKLLVIASEAHSDKDWEAMSVALLQNRIEKTADTYTRRHSVDMLMWLYLQGKQIDQAQTLADKERVDPNLLHDLARRLGDKPERATRYYKNLAETHVEKGNNDGYKDSIAMLQELAGLSDHENHQQIVAEIVAQLRLEYRRKRNFIKWLNEAFPLTASA